MFNDATPLTGEAKILAVSTISGRQRAADLWDAIRAFRKQAEAQKETVCRPLKTAWDEAKVPYDTFVKECQGHESTLQKLMSEWDQKQEAFARAEQAKIQAAIDARNAKIIEKAEAKGVEPVLRTAPVVQMPERNILTQAGSIQGRTSHKIYGVKGAPDGTELKSNDLRITEIMAAFPMLCVFDWVAFRKLASTGMLDSCPQVEQREEYTYVQRSGGR